MSFNIWLVYVHHSDLTYVTFQGLALIEFAFGNAASCTNLYDGVGKRISVMTYEIYMYSFLFFCTLILVVVEEFVL